MEQPATQRKRLTEIKDPFIVAALVGLVKRPVPLARQETFEVKK